MSNTPLLDTVDLPIDLRKLERKQLPQLADELRQKTIELVSKTGGHLGAGLGVVELTTALHYVFNTPEDKIIWDVGHQTYPHKILTGRRDKMPSLRQEGGISGFTKRSESEYDAFGAGHSSTSISAALGMAVARDKSHAENEVIAVIGDGSISAGMAYEALNNAKDLNTKLLVVLNDNEMSIAAPTGAMSAYLSRMISSESFLSARSMAKKAVSHLPESLQRLARTTEKYAKNMTMQTNLFEELGFYYIGPIDGHNMDHLLPVLENIRDTKEQRPILLHVVTEKGRGFDSPEECKEKFHAVKSFDVSTKVQKKSSSNRKSYTKVFAESLVQLAQNDEKIIGITAAMPSGTGMDIFEKSFPDRMFDVGIAEQHAVTFAAGLATEGFKPFCAIYSTFLQRAYDQVVHDVALQNLPVRFAIDRAGLVGADGATHAGSFDIAYLCTLPNMVVMAASNEEELARMVATAANYNKGPIAFRFPRGEGIGKDIPKKLTGFRIGKGHVVQKGSDVAILSFGARLQEAMGAAKILADQTISTTVADARFAKPLDSQLIEDLLQNHDIVLTIEEGAMGGFGSHVLEHVHKNNPKLAHKVRTLCLPDIFMDHATPERMYEQAFMDASNIATTLHNLLKQK